MGESNNELLDSEGFLGFPDGRFVVHTIEAEGPYKGKKIRLKSMGSDTWQEIALRVYKWQTESEPYDQHSAVVQASAVDADGGLIFSEADIPALGQRDSEVMQELFIACSRLNGKLPGMEDELEKKSEGLIASNGSENSA